MKIYIVQVFWTYIYIGLPSTGLAKRASFLVFSDSPEGAEEEARNRTVSPGSKSYVTSVISVELAPEELNGLAFGLDGLPRKLLAALKARALL